MQCNGMGYARAYDDVTDDVTEWVIHVLTKMNAVLVEWVTPGLMMNAV